MTCLRHKAAVIGALMSDPNSALNLELKSVGVEEAWFRIEHGHPSIPQQLRQRLLSLDVAALMARGTAAGARVVMPGDDDWPAQLDALNLQSPWALWVRGQGLEALAQQRSVAIVGARACTRYGERAASEFAAGLAARSLPVVSGGAMGIDAAAHRGALAVEGVTVAVLACGIDVAYPREHSVLFERIAERGLVVTEAAPGAHPTRPAFLVRNRLIAALAYGTVVVEARVRSGSISTYCHARNLNRVLMAVPGPITSPESGGTNALLQDDAQLVTSADDVAALVAPLGSVPLEQMAPAKTEWDGLTRDEREVHEVLPPRAPISVEVMLARVSPEMGMARVFGALAMLAERGLVQEQASGEWKRMRALRGAEA